MLRQSRRRVLVLAVLSLLATLAVTVPSAHAATPALSGVQLHSLWWDSSSSDMDRELDLARDAGSNVVRVDDVWGSLETGGKGQYSQWYVDKLDRFVAGAAARGMKVIATLHGTPCWASSAPESVRQGCAGAWWDRGVGAYPPTNPNDYGDVASWVTSRYGTQLAALEVWNEPNITEEHFWKTPDKAGDYARLLKAAYPGAKAGNSQVPVLAGGLAFADRPFLDQLYAHGIRGFHDGVAIHPYNEWRHPADRWQEQWKKYTLLPGVEWVRQGMLANNDDKPIWITEFGWTDGTASGWQVSSAQQAEYLGSSFALLAEKSYVRAAVVYNLREKGTDAASHEDNFGLVNRNFTPKPAYHALKQALTSGYTPSDPPPSGGASGGAAATPSTPVTPASPAAASAKGSKARGKAKGKAKTKRVRRPSARLVRKGARARLKVVGTAGQRVRVGLERCRVAGAARSWTVRLGARGTSVRTLRSARLVSGCRARATVV